MWGFLERVSRSRDDGNTGGGPEGSERREGDRESTGTSFSFANQGARTINAYQRLSARPIHSRAFHNTMQTPK